jgi:nucleotide-binding universal stress UspA family protein
MVQLPGETSFRYTAPQRQRIRAESEKQIEPLRERYEQPDVYFETSTIVSYRTFEEIFNQAKKDDTDLVVMGWEPDKNWNTLHAVRPLEELTSDLPCDFLVFKDRGMDPSRILLPTAGGPDSSLGAEVTSALQAGMGVHASLLHVVDGPEEREQGEKFLQEWAEEHDLDEAELLVDDSGDVGGAIVGAAEDQTMLVIGATERGMLARLAGDSLHINVIDDIECSVLLAERPYDRSLFQRLFGRGQRRR